MSLNRFEGDVFVAGNLGCTSITLPASSVEADDIEANAGIEYTKLEHEHRAGYAQANTAAADETRAVAVIRGTTGTLLSFKAGSIAKAVGDATCTVDLKKNGTTVLSGVITLDSGNTNRVSEAGTLSVTTLAADDLLEVVIDGTIGTGTLPTGVYCEVRWAEDAN
jgi:hypothetical protein